MMCSSSRWRALARQELGRFADGRITNGLIDRVLETAAIGARLSFEFEGRELAIGFDFGKASAEFRYRIGGGEWRTEKRERPDWVSADGWYRLSYYGDDWKPGKHRFEAEVIHGNRPDCSGSNFRLAKVGIIR
ncbi:hypothetical protein [Paenibacillus harenae]|uniref:hypothetical protein n=1 Tax=Paenibacillus harenae TaxID=306543 RepID=UPI0012EB2BD7|nr:hypothetical protein [Paenibacillus harenae]